MILPSKGCLDLVKSLLSLSLETQRNIFLPNCGFSVVINVLETQFKYSHQNLIRQKHQIF